MLKNRGRWECMIYVHEKSVDEYANGFWNVEWADENLDTEFVIPLTEQQVYDLDTCGLLDVIREVTDYGLLGVGEEDVIFDRAHKLEILRRLRDFD